MTTLYKWRCPSCGAVAAAYLDEKDGLDLCCPKCGLRMNWRRSSRRFFLIKIKLQS